jgi:hypothetical protein
MERTGGSSLDEGKKLDGLRGMPVMKTRHLQKLEPSSMSGREKNYVGLYGDGQVHVPSREK